MAVAFVTSAENTGAANGGACGSVDSSGGTLLAIVLGYYSGTTLNPNVSDSKGNTYVTAIGPAISSEPVSRMYYVNGAPTVGSSHTAAVTGTSIFSSFEMMVFSGTATAGALDQTNSATAGSGVHQIQPGSITPSENNELVITGLSYKDTTTTSLSGATKDMDQPYQASVCEGYGGGYTVQTTAAAINPTWSWTNNAFSAAVIASFKSAAASTPSVLIKLVGPGGGLVGGSFMVAGSGLVACPI